MDMIINTRLLANPMNWISISLMLVIVALAALVIHSRFQSSTVAEMPDNPSSAFAQES